MLRTEDKFREHVVTWFENALSHTLGVLVVVVAETICKTLFIYVNAYCNELSYDYGPEKSDNLKSTRPRGANGINSSPDLKLKKEPLFQSESKD